MARIDDIGVAYGLAGYYYGAQNLPRGRGLRIKLSKIKDITGSERVLRTPYVFQCPPLEEFTYSVGREHNPYITVARRTHLQRGAQKLITVTFRTLVVEWGSFVVEHRYDVENMRDQLLVLANQGYPMRMIATHKYGATPILSMNAVLTDVAVTEQAGETDARYFDLSFTQWVDPVVQVQGKGKKRSGGRAWPKVVTVTKNDYSGVPHEKHHNPGSGQLTFHYLASTFYGDPTLAKHLARANGVKDYGMGADLLKYPKYKRGGKINIPDPDDLKSVTGGGEDTG